MRYGGYMGKMLYVDLTSKNIKEEELDLSLAGKFIGDWGIGARLAYDLIKPGIDSLSPENFIIIGAGPLAGTSIPGASRTHAWSKWPVTNTIGPAGGPMFGSRLKYAGYDELIITGRADKPVYLKISDDGVEILDAGDLWGQGIYEATDEIWKRHGSFNSVICIGQAGENLVRISLAIIDKSGTLGRFGLGAVMGSKNLKAIVAGGKKGVRVSDPARLTKLTDRMMSEMMNWPIREEFVRLGHLEYDFDPIQRIGMTKNYYTELIDVGTLKERLGPAAYLERAKKARLACPSCPIACRDIEQVKEGEYEGLISYQCHTDHLVAGHLDLQSIEELVRYSAVLQGYGIDRVAFTASAEFLLYLHNRGIIGKDDLEGLEMGNEKSLSKLAEKIAFRQGIGNVLADGLPGIINRFGKECEQYGNYIKGADVFFDPRVPKLKPFWIDLVVAPYGPCNGKGGMLNPGKFAAGLSTEVFMTYGKQMGIPPGALDRIFDTPFKVNMARYLSHTEDFYAVLCCLGMCMRFHMYQFYYSMERLAQLYSSVTGIEIDAHELKGAGEKSWNILKLLNVREGLSRKDDRFPRVWLEPLKCGEEEIRMMDYYGTKVLTAEDLEKMLDDYYDERGWEVATGIPTQEKLIELGLADCVDALS